MQTPLVGPQSETEGCIIIIPGEVDQTSIAGISYHYKEYYPAELENYIEFDDYQKMITDINDTVKSNWPCLFTICLGYVLCPVTLGLSLLLPGVCLGSVEEELKMIVDTANKDFLSRKGAFMEFKRERAKSWFQITLPNQSPYIKQSPRRIEPVNLQGTI